MKRILFITLILLTACRTHNSPETKDLRVIDVAGALDDIKKVNLSYIANSIEYIPLETIAESLLGLINNKCVIYENNILYLTLREQYIKTFNNNGFYISSFKRVGRGYGEYINIFDVELDIANNNLCIEGGREINEYKQNGTFIRKIVYPKDEELKRYSFYNFKKLGNYYISTVRIDTNSVYSAIVRDSNSRVVMKIDYPQEEVNYVKKLKRENEFLNPHIFKFNNRVRLINGNNKYILSISSDLTVDTAYIINYGKLSIANISPEDKRKFPPYLGRRFDAFESDNYLFMQFFTGTLVKNHAIRKNKSTGKEYIHSYNCCLFNKKTGKVTLLEQPEIDHLGFVDDFEKGPAIWPLYVSSDNYMISLISAYDLKKYVDEHKVSEKLKVIADDLKESDNYVLVRVKLKSDN